MGERPVPYALRVAEAKAVAVQKLHPSRAILASDTVVALNEQILGKASDRAHAERMLAELSGHWHKVHTAVVLLHAEQKHEVVVSTDVRFRSLSAEEISRYVDSGEPMDKAGAYGIQGLGGALVAEVKGSYNNVVGLPLEETLKMLKEAGLCPAD